MHSLQINDTTFLQKHAINHDDILLHENNICLKNKLPGFNSDDQITREKTFSDINCSYKESAKFGKFNNELFSDDGEGTLNTFLSNDNLSEENDDDLIKMRCERLRQGLSRRDKRQNLEKDDKLDIELDLKRHSTDITNNRINSGTLNFNQNKNISASDPQILVNGKPMGLHVTENQFTGTQKNQSNVKSYRKCSFSPESALRSSQEQKRCN